MALQIKDYVNQFGVEEGYWRILGININLQYRYVDITMGGYNSKEERDLGKEPMNTKKVRAKWSEDEFDAYFAPKTYSMSGQDIYSIAYQYVKDKDPMFKDCKDC